MGRKQRNISEYKGMWLFALFDLPVDSPKARREYTRFRASLLKEGFRMLQFSVYARYCDSEDKTNIIKKRLNTRLPPAGQVRFLAVTDHQFGKMQVYHGKTSVSVEKPPEQLLLF